MAKKKSSSASFTILVGVLAAAAFAIAFAASPKTSIPTPTGTLVQGSDIRLAESLYNFDLQAIKVAQFSVENSGDPKLNELGKRWTSVFSAQKVALEAWLKQNHQTVNAKGRGMNREFNLPSPALQELVGAKDAQIAQTAIGLINAFASGTQNVNPTDPTIARFISETGSQLAADKTFLATVVAAH